MNNVVAPMLNNVGAPNAKNVSATSVHIVGISSANNDIIMQVSAFQKASRSLAD